MRPRDKSPGRDPIKNKTQPPKKLWSQWLFRKTDVDCQAAISQQKQTDKKQLVLLQVLFFCIVILSLKMDMNSNFW